MPPRSVRYCCTIPRWRIHVHHKDTNTNTDTDTLNTWSKVNKAFPNPRCNQCRGIRSFVPSLITSEYVPNEKLPKPAIAMVAPMSNSGRSIAMGLVGSFLGVRMTALCPFSIPSTSSFDTDVYIEFCTSLETILFRINCLMFHWLWRGERFFCLFLPRDFPSFLLSGEEVSEQFRYELQRKKYRRCIVLTGMYCRIQFVIRSESKYIFS